MFLDDIINDTPLKDISTIIINPINNDNLKDSLIPILEIFV